MIIGPISTITTNHVNGGTLQARFAVTTRDPVKCVHTCIAFGVLAERVALIPEGAFVLLDGRLGFDAGDRFVVIARDIHSHQLPKATLDGG